MRVIAHLLYNYSFIGGYVYISIPFVSVVVEDLLFQLVQSVIQLETSNGGREEGNKNIPLRGRSIGTLIFDRGNLHHVLVVDIDVFDDH